MLRSRTPPASATTVGLVVAVGLVLSTSCAAGTEDPPRSAARAPRSTQPVGTALTERPPDEPQPDVAPTITTTLPTDTTADEAAVLAAVDCYWTTIVEANDPPDPDHPGFDRCFTGPALERSRQRTQDHREAGRYVRDPTGTTETFGSTVRFSGGRAEVRQCAIDDAVVLDLASNRVLNDEVVSGQLTIHLVPVDGSWMVFDSVLGYEEPGREACV